MMCLRPDGRATNTGFATRPTMSLRSLSRARTSSAQSSVTAGTGAGSASVSSETSTATASRSLPSSRSNSRTGQPKSRHRHELARDHGPILASSLYDGEHHDARLELAGWAEPSYGDRKWSGVRVAPRPASALVAPTGPPVRRIELLEPVDILESPSGRPIIDFGQNLVGRLRISVDGDRGRTITIRHAEVLEHGELACALSARPPPPTATHSPVVEKRSGSRGSPSTVFVTPRSTAGQAN